MVGCSCPEDPEELAPPPIPLLEQRPLVHWVSSLLPQNADTQSREDVGP